MSAFSRKAGKGFIMKLFRSAAERELDRLREEIDIDLSNNYKSVAHDARKRFGARIEELYAAGRLKEADYLVYRAQFDDYTEKMKDYHH